MKKVLVAMSGGVDSSVAAALLCNDGYMVCGITMKIGSNEKAITDAARICEALKIEHKVVDVNSLFRQAVIDNFIQEYCQGRTPNPCIRCNMHIKFGYLLESAFSMGYDYLATGHYASIRDGGLFRGTDTKKDQSYFLYPLYSKNIARVIFPLGRYTKQQVREIATKIGFSNAQKEESQDICFVSQKSYTEFVNENRSCDQASGPIMDLQGNLLGTHCGICNYTIGQRKGLGAFGRRMFVKEICPEKNAIIVAESKDLFSGSIVVKNVVFGFEKITVSETYSVQVRYKSKPVDCHIDEISDNALRIKLSEPVRAVAPGQSAVIYKENKVLAGGLIERI
ncbi:MAG: tRNA 2-thiouridine(34) synthase MnmA [Fibrobacter sp.]|nr:tRNA 2-thiouridine(34) synthase MnmA [Fibrobacter sp.]